MDAEEIAAAMYAFRQPHAPIGGEPVKAAPVPDPSAATSILRDPGAAPAQPTQEPPKPSSQDEAARAVDEMYEAETTAPTRGAVDWNEPPVSAEDLQVTLPAGMLDTSDEGKAALVRLRDGFASVGIGQSLANEIFGDVGRAQQGAEFPISATSAERDLRAHFGAGYDAQVAAARGLVQKVAQRCPEVIPFLERTGLGNNPEFIKKVAAAAARRR